MCSANEHVCFGPKADMDHIRVPIPRGGSGVIVSMFCPRSFKGGEMTIARKVTLAFAVIVAIAAFDTAYALQPCCSWVGGKYINLKTGKEVTPPKGSVAPARGEAKPATPNKQNQGGGGGYRK
jgi:hypothetical protein